MVNRLTRRADETYVLALVKGEERYVFLYDDSSRAEALRTLDRFAINTELSFSWFDAAVLSQRIRQESNMNCPINERTGDEKDE